MAYAEIVNGVCANAVEAEKDFAALVGLVEIPDGFWIGDWYRDGVWVHPSTAPTTEERIEALETAAAQADETAIELYENQLAAEETNAAQDEALIELYEMIGG